MIERRFGAVLLCCAAMALGACGSDSSGPSDLECEGGLALTIGANVGGVLEQGDALDVDGAFLDRYALTVTGAGPVEITMRSTAVDAFLWLLSESGAVLAQDDDSGLGVNGLDAQITETLSEGCYLVEATTFEGETGAYTLTVERP